MEYEKLLEKAMKDLPEKLTSRERFQLPKGDIFYEGNTTIIKNFGEMANSINREGRYFLSYLLNELGTAGDRDGGRAILQGKIPRGRIQKSIEEYVNRYVICHECKRPDTHLVREGRTLILRCDACGAFRPIGRKK